MLNNKEKTASKAKALIIALSVNILIVLVCFFVFYPVFETNDDNGLIAIASGIRGVREPHIVHTNILIGKLITSLYAANEAVQWWSVLQLLLLFVSFFMVTYIFIRDDISIAKVLFVTAVIAFFSYEGYVRIQYTKSAGIFAAAGLILIFYGLLKKRPEKSFIIIGILLALAGSFYRFQQFLCIVAIFAAMVIYAIMCYAQDYEKPGKRIAAAVAVGAILLIAAGGLRAYDRSQYKDPDWAAYLEFDKYRTEVLDYRVPDYDEHKEEYESIGIDKTAYKLMKSWTFQDPEKFTAETFKTIASFNEKRTINTAFIKKFVKGFAKGLRDEAAFLCFGIVLLGWLIAGKHRVRKWVSLVVMGAAILAMNAYLYYAGRFMINRVDVGIWFAAALILLYQCLVDTKDDGKEDAYKADPATEGGSSKASIFRKAVMIVLCVAIAGAFVFEMPWRSGLKSKAMEKAAAAEPERIAIEKISSDKDHLYLTKVGVLGFSEVYGVMDPQPYKIADNIYPLGGWGAATPAYLSVLKRYNVDNPFRDMIGNEKVYIVDNKINDTLAYLRKWYKPDAEAELVDNIEGHKIYRIK